MLRRFYDWVLSQVGRPHAIWVMGLMSFAESSVFPLPPDFLLVPMMLADRRRVFWFATVATVTSVLGGFLGYAIGYYAFGTIGEWVIRTLSTQSAFDNLHAFFDNYGFWAIVLKGLTPIPFKIVTILSGFLHFDLAQFAVASIIARGMRFFAEALLLYALGDRGRSFIEERLTLVTTVSAAVVVGGVVLIRYF